MWGRAITDFNFGIESDRINRIFNKSLESNKCAEVYKVTVCLVFESDKCSNDVMRAFTFYISAS